MSINISSADLSRITAHIESRLLSCPGHTDPCAHLTFHDFFPADIYEKILREFPAGSLFHEFAHKDAMNDDGTSNRSALVLDPRGLDKLDASGATVFRVIHTVFSSEKVMRAIYTRFQEDLEPRLAENNAEFDKSSTYLHIAILQDRNGYKITPHTDTMRKLVTLHVYLPQDESQKQVGTSFYRPKIESGVMSFITVKTLDFLPNTGFVFPVTKNSWHGTSELNNLTTPRNSLSVLYFQKEDEGYHASPPLTGNGHRNR